MNKTGLNSNKNNVTLVLVLLALFPFFHGGASIIESSLFLVLIFITFFYYLISKTLSLNTYQSFKLPIYFIVIWAAYITVSFLFIQNNSQIKVVAELMNFTHSSNTLINSQNLNAYLLFLSYFSIFFIILFNVKNKNDVLKIAFTLFLTSVVLAVYSLINSNLGGEISFNSSQTQFSREEWNNRIRGPFNYHAHYASFQILTIPFGLALTYFHYKKINISSTSLTRRVIQILLSQTTVYALGTIIMIFALIKTNSRAGNFSFFLSIVLTYFIVIFLNKNSISLKSNLKKNLALLFVGISLIFVSGIADPLISRYIKDGTDLHGRQYAYKTAITIIKTSPLMGNGIGNYSNYAEKHKDFDSAYSTRDNKSHAMNDYLQLTAEQGVIGLILYLCLVITVLIKLIPNLKYNRTLFPFITACLSASTGVLIHSLGDFIMQLPIISIYMFCILALGLKCCYLQGRRSKE